MLHRTIVVVACAVLMLIPSLAWADPWLLTYPPLTPNTKKPNPSAPMKEWTVWQLIPTEQRCRDQKELWHMVIAAKDEEGIRAAARRAIFAQGIPPPSANLDLLEREAREWVRDNGTKVRRDEGAMNQILAAECISSDDPRLAPPKPSP